VGHLRTARGESGGGGCRQPGAAGLPGDEAARRAEVVQPGEVAGWIVEGGDETVTDGPGVTNGQGEIFWIPFLGRRGEACWSVVFEGC
jgi:hypothetical protein